MSSSTKLGFGGGCHWCTEAIFQALPDVDQVDQGYIMSESPYESWSEAVIVHFSAREIITNLLEIHLATHKSTSKHSRRSEYRSAIYYFEEESKLELEDILISLSRKGNKNYITKILPFKNFKPSRESIQNYYQTRPDAPFCTRYIKPKLSIVHEISSSSGK